MCVTRHVWYNDIMEGQEYLNQISAETRPVKKSKSSKIFSSKLFIGGMIALVLLIIMIIIGAILGGSKDKEKNLSIALALHLNNTSGIIEVYQPSVKSSDLRSNSASLLTMLTSTNRDLMSYLVERYNFKEKDVDKKISEQADLEKDELESDLFEAKINGVLDRIYAHKMAYEISAIMSEEARIMEMTKNETLGELLKTSYSSLRVLYEEFNNFSEAKH